MNELLALLAVITALRVFLPDAAAGMRRLLRAGARLGVAELLHHHTTLPTTTEAPVTLTARDGEA